MACQAVALCAFLFTWLTDHSFDPIHRDAVITYVQHESGFDPNVIVNTGACLFQFAGARRRIALQAGNGRCPPVTWQLERMRWELLNVRAYACFWRERTYTGALQALRRGFGAGHC